MPGGGVQSSGPKWRPCYVGVWWVRVARALHWLCEPAILSVPRCRLGLKTRSDHHTRQASKRSSSFHFASIPTAGCWLGALINKSARFPTHSSHVPLPCFSCHMPHTICSTHDSPISIGVVQLLRLCIAIMGRAVCVMISQAQMIHLEMVVEKGNPMQPAKKCLLVFRFHRSYFLLNLPRLPLSQLPGGGSDSSIAYTGLDHE